MTLVLRVGQLVSNGSNKFVMEKAAWPNSPGCALPLVKVANEELPLILSFLSFGGKKLIVFQLL